MRRLDAYFGLNAKGSSVGREILAGLTTFLTMSYILFVNPAILSEAGMDAGGVFVATCLAAAFGSLVMGVYANLPVALAPGMGMNAFFTYSVVLGLGVPWQTALGAVFISGVVFVAVSITLAREWIIDVIPKDLKLALAAGVGLFLTLIGLRSGGVTVDSAATLVTVGDLSALPTLLMMGCFLLIAVLDARKIPGAILIGMLVMTLVGYALGVGEFQGVVSVPPDPSSTFLQMDVLAALDIALLSTILTLIFIDVFETTGTLIGVTQSAGLLDEKGKLPGLPKALLADSLATVAGAVAGTSSTTSYVESVAGVRSGGRTGLSSVVVAGCFLLSLFLAPLAGSVGAFATGAALTYVGCLMATNLSKIDWQDSTVALPCIVAALTMPFTFSIVTGLGFGVISYGVLKLATQGWAATPKGVILLALLFLLKFAFLG